MTSPSPRKKRLFSCLGCVVAGPLGCLAFLGGAVLVGVLFLPDVVAGTLRREVPEEFEGLFAGELSIADVRLSWSDEQRLDDVVLRDPEGRQVCRASVRGPSILTWWDGNQSLGEIHVELEGDLVVDGEGRTNLARALEPLPGTTVSTEGSWREMLRGLFGRDGRLVVDVTSLRVTTPELEAAGRTLDVLELEATARFAPGRPIEVEARAVLGGDHRGTVSLEALVDRDVFRRTADGDPHVRGTLRARDLSTELVDDLFALHGAAREALGDALEIDVALDPASDGGAPFRATLRSDAARADLAGTIVADGLLAPLAPSPWRALRVEGGATGLAAPAATRLACRLLGREVGEVAGAAWDADERVGLRRLEVAWPESAEERVTAAMELDLPALAFGTAPRGPFELHGGRLVVERDRAWRVELAGALADDGRGTVSFVARSSDSPRAWLADGPRDVQLAVEGRSLPCDVLDRLLGLEGEIVHAAGDSLDLSVTVDARAAEPSPLSISLRSSGARAFAEGTLDRPAFDRDALLSGLDLEGDVENVPLAACARVLSVDLPPGVRLEWGGNVAFAFEGWRRRTEVDGDAVAPVRPGAPPPGSRAPEDAEPWVGGGGSLTLTIPRLTYVGPEYDQTGLELALTDVDVTARGDADHGLVVYGSADLAAGGSIETKWTLFGPRGPFGLHGRDDLRLTTDAVDVPAVLLDARMRADGLVQAIFGERVSWEASGGGLSAGGGRLEGRLGSPRAEAVVRAFHERGVQFTDVDLLLSFAVDVASVDALVRPLVPLLDRVEAVPRPGTSEAARGVLQLTDGVLPIDGDAARLAGSCTLELGHVRAVVSERLRSFLVEDAAGDGAPVELEPIVLVLDEGRVRCDAAALPIGGTLARIDGTYAIGGADLDLQTELPLGVVGSNVNLVLATLRERLQPDFGVPIVVSGDADELDLAIRPQWIRTVADVMGQFVPDVFKDTVKELLSDETDDE